MKETQLESANKENFELGEELNKMFEMLTELTEKNRDNEISQKEKFVEEEIKIEMIGDMNKLNKYVSDLENTIKIIEIERDEAYTRTEELQMKLDSQTSHIKNSNRLHRDMERQIKNLKRKNEEYEKTWESMSKKFANENNLESSEMNFSNFGHKNLHTESTRFSSICSTQTYNHVPKELSKNYHTRSLSTLIPDIIFEEEIEKSDEYKISVTSCDLVKKMSNKIIAPLHKDTDINKSKNDIYKDFFLLTFQSLKLNSKNIESYIDVNPELLYREIINKNIPFHEVYKHL